MKVQQISLLECWGIERSYLLSMANEEMVTWFSLSVLKLYKIVTLNEKVGELRKEILRYRY